MSPGKSRKHCYGNKMCFPGSKKCFPTNSIFAVEIMILSLPGLQMRRCKNPEFSSVYCSIFVLIFRKIFLFYCFYLALVLAICFVAVIINVKRVRLV